ncbi:M24 family metallopeptidase [Aeromicrobium sp.]|uniref:M24 family metallopeptidase n=1 Tax=Aeromicrobium sp. TaxID=1871063 RepID=UPI003D6AAF12
MSAPTAEQLVDRRSRAVAALDGLGTEGLLVTTLVNVRYLTGFTGSNGALVLGADGAGTFLTDGRYRDQAAEEVPDLDHFITRDLLGEAAKRMPGSWACETHTMSVDEHATLQEAGVSVVSASRLVERLREIKDDGEIDALRRACQISVDALQDLLAGPLAGRTETQVARDLEWRMLELGAEAIGFETILASGPNSAIPHHRATDRVLQIGDLVKADFGARVDGYHADCTRTVVLGAADDWQREIHAAVQASQAAGVDALREGTPVAASDEVARKVLDDAGWLERFTTGVGHGVGLEIHEDPFIGRKHVGRLASRTTLTMEPGIYLPGRGGVRIEDTVLVTPDAPEVLTTMTTDLLEIA